MCYTYHKTHAKIEVKKPCEPFALPHRFSKALCFFTFYSWILEFSSLTSLGDEILCVFQDIAYTSLPLILHTDCLCAPVYT